MRRKDIVLKISEELNQKQVDVKRIVKKIFDLIIDSLAKGEKVEFRNFGIFKIKQRKPRLGRNLKTGVVVPVPSRKVVIFKPGLEMKKRIR